MDRMKAAIEHAKVRTEDQRILTIVNWLYIEEGGRRALEVVVLKG
jgi:hypothetical protein